MSKPKRNHPCSCGSGRKYKKCCGKKKENIVMDPVKNIVTPNGLKNEYREELEKKEKDPVEIEAEKVGEAEMLRRDQYVTMRQLLIQKKMMQQDYEYNDSAIKVYQEFLDEISELPISEGREGVLRLIQKQIGSLIKNREDSIFPRPNEITLSALQDVCARNPHSKLFQEKTETPINSYDDNDDEPDELRDE